MAVPMASHWLSHTVMALPWALMTTPCQYHVAVPWHRHGDAMGVMTFHPPSCHFNGVHGLSRTAMGLSRQCHGGAMAIAGVVMGFHDTHGHAMR